MSDNERVQQRIPPQNLEAEQSVLGGLMLDNTAFERVGDLLSERDFYRDDHRRIWRHIAKLIEKGRPADVVTVDESIKSSEDRDKTGGLSYLGALAQNTPSAQNIRRYGEIVRDRAIMRKQEGDQEGFAHVLARLLELMDLTIAANSCGSRENAASGPPNFLSRMKCFSIMQAPRATAASDTAMPNSCPE